MYSINNMIKRNTLVVSLLSLAFVVSHTASVKAESNGKQLYLQNCSVCHADDGSSAMPGVIDLKENRVWSKQDNDLLLAKLRNGIRSPVASISMPAKGGNPNLTDNDLKKIINYMRQSFLK